MDLFEYQAKDLFAKHGVPVLAGIVADTAEEARAAAEEIGGVTVVKAQVKAGGRGKAGGVKVAKTPDEAVEQRERHPRHGHQGPHRAPGHGRRRRADIARGVLLLLPARPGQPLLPLHLRRVEGGMEIEELAVERPDAARARSRRPAAPASTRAKAAEIVDGRAASRPS